MPIDKKTQMILAAIVPIEKGKAFKRMAKKHYRSVSAELVALIDKALEDEKEKSK